MRCDGFALVVKAALLSEASAAIWKFIGTHCDCGEYTSRWAERMVAPRGMVTPVKRNPAKLVLALAPLPSQIVAPFETKLLPSSFTSSAAVLTVKVVVCTPLEVVAVGVKVGVLLGTGVLVKTGVKVGVLVGAGVLLGAGVLV